MKHSKNLRIALQKSGRLTKKCLDLLARCGLDFETDRNQLLCRAENYPVELMLVRDDDIPGYVREGVCDLGVVGLNELKEKVLDRDEDHGGIQIIRNLGFARCRLALALPNKTDFQGIKTFNGMAIATSYPVILAKYLKDNAIRATVVEVSGSVEVAPAIGVAEAVCDLVSTGATLESNGLREVQTIFESEAVLVRTGRSLDDDKLRLVSRLVDRMEGVQRAEGARYVMMNAPKNKIAEICEVLPGMENPTIMPLGNDDTKVAIHAVAYKKMFWETMERLKELGATSILVMPIEKILG